METQFEQVKVGTFLRRRLVGAATSVASARRGLSHCGRFCRLVSCGLRQPAVRRLWLLLRGDLDALLDVKPLWIKSSCCSCFFSGPSSISRCDSRCVGGADGSWRLPRSLLPLWRVAGEPKRSEHSLGGFLLCHFSALCTKTSIKLNLYSFSQHGSPNDCLTFLSFKSPLILSLIHKSVVSWAGRISQSAFGGF